MLGWGAAALAQRTPLVIIILEAKKWDVVAVGLTVLSTLIGLRWIIDHQLQDRDNDRRSGVHTVATAQDPQRLIAMSHVLFTFEFACACAVVATMSYFVPPVGVAALAYTGGLGARGKPPSPVTHSEYFYCVVWPITLAVMLSFQDPVFLSMLFVAFTFVPRNGWQNFRAAFAQLRAAPTSPERLARKVQIDKADPYRGYARLRGMGPVLRLNWGDLGSTWIVLRHHEAITAFNKSRFFRRADNLAAAIGGENPQQNPVRGLEPPDHTRVCKLVDKAFNPLILQRLHGQIEQVADQILDRAKSRSEIELMSEYASVIPTTTISELLGLRIGDSRKFRAFIYALAVDHMLDRKRSDLEGVRSRFTNRLHELFVARRATPQDDLLTSLVHLEQDGERLSPQELTGIVYSLLLGGVMTTNVIGNGMLALSRHPEQLELLRQNAQLADSAIEELLRFDSPFELSAVCLPSTDVELGRVRIPGGAPVRVLIPSANRDELQFARPDALDITRNPCPHLSFDQAIHYRIAAPLVRLESKIAINMLIERAPNLRLGDTLQIKWAPNPVLRGLQQLPLRL